MKLKLSNKTFYKNHASNLNRYIVNDDYHHFVGDSNSYFQNDEFIYESDKKSNDDILLVTSLLRQNCSAYEVVIKEVEDRPQIHQSILNWGTG